MENGKWVRNRIQVYGANTRWKQCANENGPVAGGTGAGQSGAQHLKKSDCKNPVHQLMQAHGMQNDRAQKFEYTTELCWKAIKCFLKEKEGVDEVSPRKIVKAYYRGGHVTEEDYLLLLETVEGRNRLSHVYNVELLNNIPCAAFPVMPRFSNEPTRNYIKLKAPNKSAIPSLQKTSPTLHGPN